MRFSLPHDRVACAQAKISFVARVVAPCLLAALAGCADLPPPERTSQVVPVACRDSAVSGVNLLDWELTVDTRRVDGGKPFAAQLGGVAVFPELFLDLAQTAVAGGVREVRLLVLRATVHVRSGAIGPDVVLTTEPIAYRCREDRRACDPANDLLPETPGFPGNTDCEPLSELNPCGRFVNLPISQDCAPDGECAELGKLETQCLLNGFCITGDLRQPLEPAEGQYVADLSAPSVLFGWDQTICMEQVGGANNGTCNFPQVNADDPPGPVAVRVALATQNVALECAMAIDCRDDPDLECVDLTSPAPNEVLIEIPIEAP